MTPFIPRYVRASQTGALKEKIRQAEEIASVMLYLQNMGCCNINLVTPSHVVSQILKAMDIAAGLGLRLPLVYNSSGYDSVETLKILRGVVDIYMPDFKFWEAAAADRYCHVNLMSQYRPMGETEKFKELSLPLSPEEFRSALKLGRASGLVLVR